MPTGGYATPRNRRAASVRIRSRFSATFSFVTRIALVLVIDNPQRWTLDNDSGDRHFNQ